jgi:hypothetical protein
MFLAYSRFSLLTMDIVRQMGARDASASRARVCTLKKKNITYDFLNRLTVVRNKTAVGSKGGGRERKTL